MKQIHISWKRTMALLMALVMLASIPVLASEENTEQSAPAGESVGYFEPETESEPEPEYEIEPETGLEAPEEENAPEPNDETLPDPDDGMREAEADPSEAEPLPGTGEREEVFDEPSDEESGEPDETADADDLTAAWETLTEDEFHEQLMLWFDDEDMEEYREGEAVYDFDFHVDTNWRSCDDILYIAVSNAATLIAAVNTVSSLGDGRYIIALAEDIAIPASDKPLLRFSAGETMLLGCGHTLSLQPADGGEPCVLVEGDGTELSLGCGLIGDGLTVTGLKPEQGEDYPALFSVTGGTLTICEGAEICCHEAGHGVGGAICVSGGVVRMLGGVIRDCGVYGAGDVFGGGVGVLWGGSFYMLGGVIQNCCAVSEEGAGYGGGVAAVSSDREEEYSLAPVQLLEGEIIGCGADLGGSAAFVGFPGIVVLGEVLEQSVGADVFTEYAEGFLLYTYSEPVIVRPTLPKSEDPALYGLCELR